jgi:mono/diheme cytochrome c family protein
MFNNILLLHKIVVSLYLLFTIIKVAMLLLAKKENTMRFRKKTMFIEITLSVLFLFSGLYLAFTSGTVREGNWFWGKVILIIAVIPIGIIAFRKFNKALAILALLILIYIYGISETHSLTFKEIYNIAAPDSTTTTPAAKIAYGQQVYATACVACHGSDGTLSLSGAFDLTKINLDKDQTVEVITNGRNNMPAFIKALTPNQINAVSMYVLTLKK